MWDSPMVDQAQPGFSTNVDISARASSGFDVNAFAVGVDQLFLYPFANITPRRH
jgi:hypothetical protein